MLQPHLFQKCHAAYYWAKHCADYLTGLRHRFVSNHIYERLRKSRFITETLLASNFKKGVLLGMLTKAPGIRNSYD